MKKRRELERKKKRQEQGERERERSCPSQGARRLPNAQKEEVPERSGNVSYDGFFRFLYFPSWSGLSRLLERLSSHLSGASRVKGCVDWGYRAGAEGGLRQGVTAPLGSQCTMALNTLESVVDGGLLSAPSDIIPSTSHPPSHSISLPLSNFLSSTLFLLLSKWRREEVAARDQQHARSNTHTQGQLPPREGCCHSTP